MEGKVYREALMFFFITLIFISSCRENSITGPNTNTSEKPKVNYFEVNPSIIKRGESATLSWSVSNCTEVVINQGIGNVCFSDSIIAEPRDSIDYLLTARKSRVFVIAKCRLEVKKGADVRMISGPRWKEDELYFTYFGEVKNWGIWPAQDTRVTIYIFDKEGIDLADEFSYIDRKCLKPGETSDWKVVFSDPHKALRKNIDKSMSMYFIKWREFHHTFGDNILNSE